ncbi:MAG: hypothetical protein LW698_06370 [Planctomycetaceae bacterium]|jgi:hypothetical protein|nr:hypothetical protein [Planctomycetaceae bacterium]
MITFAAAWKAKPSRSQPLAAPHEVLGLPPDTTDAGLIVQAARRRLNAIRDAYGSQEDVKDALVSTIVAARQAMLAQANVEAGR